MIAIYVNKGSEESGYLDAQGRLTAWMIRAAHFDTIAAAYAEIDRLGFRRDTGVMPGTNSAYPCFAP